MATDCGGSPAYTNGSILVTLIDGVCVVTPEKRVEDDSVQDLEAGLAYALGAGSAPVILDLDAFPRHCPRAVAAIHAWAERFERLKRPFAVCTSVPFVALLLERLVTRASIRVFPGLGEALRAVRPQAATPLGQILVERFGLGRHELYHALRKQKREGGLLGRILLGERLVEPAKLMRALAAQAEAC